jgi:hypothetical protein
MNNLLQNLGKDLVNSKAKLIRVVPDFHAKTSTRSLRE